MSASLFLVLALAVYAAGVATEIRLPGLYFDEVNPDYLVVPLVYPGAQSYVAWLPPGNYLDDMYPLLVQLYHGALPVYVGWPLYEIFGTGIEGVRIAHGIFGAAVLVATWALMRAARAPAWIAGLLCTTLAIDPAFLFAFRTHYYILLLPFVFFAMALLAADAARGASGRFRAVLLFAASGLLGGIACYGYFVYFALVPALAWFALAKSNAAFPHGSAWLAWAVGFAVAISPYPVGVALMVDALGSVSAALAWITATTSNLQAGIDFGGPVDRVLTFFQQLHSMVSARGFTQFLFGEPVGQQWQWLRLALLFVPALGVVPMLRASRPADRIGIALAVSLLGLFALTLIFGMRLATHHFLPALPILYVLAAIGALRWKQRAEPTATAGTPPAASRAPAAVGAVAATAAVLGALNVVHSFSVFERLRETGGVWLFNESVTRFAEAEARQGGAVFHYFPDWGLFTSFAMITHGKLPFLAEFPIAQARWFLCGGKNVVIATTEGGDRRVADWTTEMGWSNPQIEHYRQRDGRLVFQTARWYAQAGPSKERPCP